MAHPTVEVAIDWADNRLSAPLASIDDVSSYVRSLTYNYERDPRTGRIDAALCTLKLQNDDHRFTPSKSTGAIVGNLRAGRDMRVRLGYPVDDFNAANASISGRSFSNDGQFSWTIQTGGFSIVSNVVEGTSVAVNRATTDTTLSDISWGMQYRRFSDLGGLAFRHTDSSNFLFLIIEQTAMELFRITGGVTTSVSRVLYSSLTDETGTTVADWASGERRLVTVVMHGESIRVFRDHRVEVIDATVVQERSATNHGIYADYTGGIPATEDTFENVGGWHDLFWGQISEPEPRPERGNQYCYIRARDEFVRLDKTRIYTQTIGARTSGEYVLNAANESGFVNSLTQRDRGLELSGGNSGQNDKKKSFIGSGLERLFQVADEEDGFILIDGRGFLVFEDRDHRDGIPHADSVVSFIDTSAGSSPHYQQIMLDSSVEYVRNRLYVTYRQADPTTTTAVVWTLDNASNDGIDYEIGSTRLFLATIKDGAGDYDLADTMQTPTSGTDFISTDIGGTTNNDLVTVTLTETTTIRFGAYLIRTVWDGVTPGTLIHLQLRSDVQTTLRDKISLVAEDTVSVDVHGELRDELDSHMIVTEEVARLNALHRLDRLSNVRPIYKIIVPPSAGGSNTHRNTLQQVHRSISDRVRLLHTDMDLDTECYIDGIILDIQRRFMTAQFILRTANHSHAQQPLMEASLTLA